MIGKVIQIKGEHKKAVEALVEPCHTATVAFEKAAGMIKNNEKRLWKAINKLYPETVGHQCAIDNKTHDVVIIGENE